MAYRFIPAPGWPIPPAGWVPPPGWSPPADWPPAPTGWQFWVDDAPAPPPVSVPPPIESVAPPPPAVPPPAEAPNLAAPPSLDRSPATIEEFDGSAKIGIFGARKRAEELQAEVAHLRAELKRLGALDIIQLDQLRHQLEAQIVDQKSQLASAEHAHQARLDQLTAEQAALINEQLAETESRLSVARAELSELQEQVVITREDAILQEIGIYQYRHPLTDALAYVGAA